MKIKQLKVKKYKFLWMRNLTVYHFILIYVIVSIFIAVGFFSALAAFSYILYGSYQGLSDFFEQLWAGLTEMFS